MEPEIDGNNHVERKVGRIARIIEAQGFCFIRADTDGRDYFCHASELANCDIGELCAGAQVTFEAFKGPKGWRAAKVWVK